MIILQNTTSSLEIKLAGSITTNQLPFVTSFVDITTTTYNPQQSTGATNNTSIVTMISAPASSTQRKVQAITVFNEDTVSATVIVQFNDNSTTRRLLKITLDANDSLQYIDTIGWRVIDETGALKQTSSGSSITPAALTKVDDTNVTLTLGGNPTSALLQAVSLSLGWTGTLADARIASAATWNAKQDALSKATTSEINTGTDNAKYIVSDQLEASKYLNQSGSKLSATASGTDTYTASITPAISSYVNTQRFFIKFTNANTGASTLNLNGLGAIPIKKSVSTALASGDILAGQILCLAYDGTNFQIVGGGGGSSTTPDNTAQFSLITSFRTLYNY